MQLQLTVNTLGDPWAQYKVGITKHGPERMVWLKLAATQCIHQAQQTLADTYTYGGFYPGEPGKDPVEARKWQDLANRRR
jgi:hypothetical protein